MAKQKENELAHLHTQNAALATASDNDLPAMYIPARDGRPPIAKIRLFNNTPEELLKWPDLKWGQFYNDTTGEPIGERVRFVAIGNYTEWAKYVKGSNRPEYVHKKLSDVPGDDAEWTGPDKKTPPVATEIITLIAIEQSTGYPYKIPFQRTAMKSFDAGFRRVEADRFLKGKSTGLYELYSERDTNAEGKPYKRLMVRYVSDLPEDLKATAKIALKSLDKLMAEAQKQDDHDEIPI